MGAGFWQRGGDECTGCQRACLNVGKCFGYQNCSIKDVLWYFSLIFIRDPGLLYQEFIFRRDILVNFFEISQCFLRKITKRIWMIDDFW